jgi:hypothetical protein
VTEKIRNNAHIPAVLAPALLLGQGRQRGTDEDDLCAGTHLCDVGSGNVMSVWRGAGGKATACWAMPEPHEAFGALLA